MIAATASRAISGSVNASLAGSHGDAGTGRLIAYGFERQGRDFSFALRSQLADPNFSQVGLQPGLPPTRRQDIVSLGMPFGRFGSVALSRVSQKSAGQPDTEVITFGYTLQLGAEVPTPQSPITAAKK